MRSYISRSFYQVYNLTFPGRHTVGQVKRDVATVTSIPVFRQVVGSFAIQSSHHIETFSGVDRVA